MDPETAYSTAFNYLNIREEGERGSSSAHRSDLLEALLHLLPDRLDFVLALVHIAFYFSDIFSLNSLDSGGGYPRRVN